jgi:AcrR family transcriptional regulator
LSESKAGRPRDPDVEKRVLDAAITVFGDLGWSKFSIEAVAREASVGKASIYLRWPDKGQLLSDALQERIPVVHGRDSGNIRDDLLNLAQQSLNLYLGNAGHVVFRMSLEGDRIPGVREHYEKLRNAQTLEARAMVRRGIERGELPKDTSVTLLLEGLIGSIILHSLSTPRELAETVRERSPEYLAQLVDFVLGCTAGHG